MEHEVNEVLEMIASGRMPPRNMIDDVSGGVASLTVLRAAAAENPSMARQLEKMMAAAGERPTKGPAKNLQKAVQQTMSQGNQTLWGNIQEAYAKEATTIDKDIASTSWLERVSTSVKVGATIGIATGTIAYLKRIAKANNLKVKGLAGAGDAQYLSKISTSLEKAIKTGDLNKIVNTAFSGQGKSKLASKKEAADLIKFFEKNKGQHKLFVKDMKAIVKFEKKGALAASKASAKLAAKSANILSKAAVVGMYTGIAGGIIGGVVAYGTIPEVEAGMRKAAAGVRVAASETYKMVKEEVNEVVEAATALGDGTAIKAAKDYAKLALKDAATAAKATVKAADSLGSSIVNAWGAARNEVAGALNLLPEDSQLIRNYDKAIEVSKGISVEVKAIRNQLAANNLKFNKASRKVISSSLEFDKPSSSAKIKRAGREMLGLLEDGRSLTTKLNNLRNEAKAAYKKIVPGSVGALGLATAFNTNVNEAIRAVDKTSFYSKATTMAQKEYDKKDKVGKAIYKTNVAIELASKKANDILASAESKWDSAMSYVSKAYKENAEAAATEGKVWVEGYLKDSGAKVKGFWRKMSDTVFGNKVGATGTAAIAQGLGNTPKK